MVQKKNPLKLNPLQLRTLTIFQHLARFPETATQNAETGETFIGNLPNPHGNHFHCGDAVVMSSDATGLKNEGVWKALERKGLLRSMFPAAVSLTASGLAYDTLLADKILHRSGH
tara:strand:+ start:440 stop:784 length:345 start_codon:yes stop_codon:yes gene_type:complete